MIGKLRHSLKEKCPECGSILQLREIEESSIVNGIKAKIPKEIICCSNKSCYYQEDVKQKRRDIRKTKNKYFNGGNMDGT